ncbi:MAG: histidine--tRNA ligase [Clostridiales bacterium 38-18]|nr:MAG: histidine--tRNA ligase [Clostridiales bacterium 38-18]
MYTTLPPTGMRDFLPREKAVREFVMSEIRDEYKKSGFTEIETSYLENIDNLTGGDGGENTKLIFKIMQRGEKLEKLLAGDAIHADDLADYGLRFDLTLPLVRFYANNRNELPSIFKAIQMGPVFRAERAQKGRYRSFAQCDIDIIGDESNLAEIEIIQTISSTLKRLGFGEFTIKISDRRILKAIVISSGFSEEVFGDVAITLDKLDKIGIEGIRKELNAKNYDTAAIELLLEKSAELESQGLEGIKEMCPEGYDNLKDILDVIGGLADTFKIVFDHTLVRGMGYYTSTIFEITYSDLGYSIAGGGRYDKMIGKISGIDVPAVGFSIGFERIVDILISEERQLNNAQKIALLFDDQKSISEVVTAATKLRQEYDIVSLYRMKKKLGKQLTQLDRAAYTGYGIFRSADEAIEVKPFEKNE